MKSKALIGIIMMATLVAACSNSGTEKVDSALVNSGTVASENVMDIKSTEPFVNIVDTCMLRIYYPKYSRIDLVCEEMPHKDNDSVILVCAAAYTKLCLDNFSHENIVGNHVSGGKLYKGANNAHKSSEKASYRGAFSFYDGKPHFAYDDWNDDFRMASSKGGCGFAQDMMIHDGGIVNHSRKNNDEDLYRALCLINGKLAVVDSKEKIPFGDFITNLLNAGASEAIYLDMGGWKHSWYRDESGKAVDIHPSPTKFGTNWITFYK